MQNKLDKIKKFKDTTLKLIELNRKKEKLLIELYTALTLKELKKDDKNIGKKAVIYRKNKNDIFPIIEIYDFVPNKYYNHILPRFFNIHIITLKREV